MHLKSSVAYSFSSIAWRNSLIFSWEQLFIPKSKSEIYSKEEPSVFYGKDALKMLLNLTFVINVDWSKVLSVLTFESSSCTFASVSHKRSF